MRWQEAPWNSVQEGQCPSGLQLPATWDDRAAMGFSAFVVWWGAKLFAQLLSFVVAGVLSLEWQGATGPAGGSSGSAAAGPGAAQGTPPALHANWQHVKTCMACAVGPSFGSLALSSLPLASPAIFLWQALSRWVLHWELELQFHCSLPVSVLLTMLDLHVQTLDVC